MISLKILFFLFFLSVINAQIGLPTFQGVHKPHSTTSGPITVAVVSDISSTSSGGRSATVAQLNDDTYYDFTATALDVDEANSASELTSYEVVIIGGTGNGSNGGYTSTFYSALNTFRQGGGGVLSTAWFVYETMSVYSNTDLQQITPYEDDGNYQYMGGSGTLMILETGHSVTSGISSFSPTSNHLEYEDAIDSGAEKLASASSNSNACTVCVHDHGSNGKTGYLGGQYMSNPNSYGTSSMRSGVEDKLLEQMVYWLAN